MNMHLSQTFSSHRAHFFPHRPTNQCRSSRASKRTTYTRRNNAEGKRGKRRMTTFQPPRITFQMNRPPRGPLFVFNISPVARAKDRPSFISRYHQLDPFFLSDRRASRPLYLSSARRCLISLARWPSRTGAGRFVAPNILPEMSRIRVLSTRSLEIRFFRFVNENSLKILEIFVILFEIFETKRRKAD